MCAGSFLGFSFDTSANSTMHNMYTNALSSSSSRYKQSSTASSDMYGAKKISKSSGQSLRASAIPVAAGKTTSSHSNYGHK